MLVCAVDLSVADTSANVAGEFRAGRPGRAARRATASRAGLSACISTKLICTVVCGMLVCAVDLSVADTSANVAGEFPAGSWETGAGDSPCYSFSHRFARLCIF